MKRGLTWTYVWLRARRLWNYDSAVEAGSTHLDIAHLAVALHLDTPKIGYTASGRSLMYECPRRGHTDLPREVQRLLAHCLVHRSVRARRGVTEVRAGLREQHDAAVAASLRLRRSDGPSRWSRRDEDRVGPLAVVVAASGHVNRGEGDRSFVPAGVLRMALASLRLERHGRLPTGPRASPPEDRAADVAELRELGRTAVWPPVVVARRVPSGRERRSEPTRGRYTRRCRSTSFRGRCLRGAPRTADCRRYVVESMPLSTSTSPSSSTARRRRARCHMPNPRCPRRR